MRQVNATQRLQIRLHWHSQDRQLDSEQIITELLGRQRVHPAYIGLLVLLAHTKVVYDTAVQSCAVQSCARCDM